MKAFRKSLRPYLLVMITAGAQTVPAAAGEPGLAGIVPAGIEVQKVRDGFKNVRGPAFSRLGYLVFSDPLDGKIWTYTPADPRAGFEVLREDRTGAQALSFDRQGRLLIAEAGARRVTRVERSGTVTVLADRIEGRPLNGPVDVVHAIDGSTYIADAAGSEGGGPLVSAVYQVMRNGNVRAVASGFGSASGLALSSDQQTLFVGDAAAGRIHAFEIVGDGKLVNGRIFGVLAPGDFTASGIRTDFDGNVYSTGPGGVWVFDSTGHHRGTISVPETPAGIAWGGNYRTLYIAAGGSLYQIPLETRGTQTY